jgi:hypothetical protein
MLQEMCKSLLQIFESEFMIDEQIKQSGETWKSYSERLGENPSNFKRKLLWNIDKINKWISPLNLELVIREKDG